MSRAFVKENDLEQIDIKLADLESKISNIQINSNDIKDIIE